VEFLHENPQVAARTLFATHYHELNELAARYERVRNYRIQVQEHNGKVIFLRKMISGGADHSYGIEVARMAGLPEPVIDRARAVLQQLESQHLVVESAGGEAEAGGDGLSARVARPTLPDADDTFQMSLFAGPPPDPSLLKLKEKLDALDTDRLTPIEALLALAELKRIAEE
jgi:DNA mismatch repair protein MutS